MKIYLIFSLLFFSMFSCKGQENSNQFIDPIERSAKYPEGDDALNIFIQQNLERRKNDSKSSVVLVEFVVEKDGKLNDFKISKGIDENYNSRALKVAKKMRLWIPATQNGKVIRQKVIIPVPF